MNIWVISCRISRGAENGVPVEVLTPTTLSQINQVQYRDSKLHTVGNSLIDRRPNYVNLLLWILPFVEQEIRILEVPFRSPPSSCGVPRNFAGH